jgi:hypothetical protein
VSANGIDTSTFNVHFNPAQRCRNRGRRPALLMHLYLSYATPIPTHTRLMPLSLRRPKRQPNPMLTPDKPFRSVSTPTLLSRLRNSTFSRSKISLSSLAYDSVRARTPPTPYQVDTPLLSPQLKKDKKECDMWEMRGFEMTKEQRECLAGAECLGIWDPVTGKKGVS